MSAQPVGRLTGRTERHTLKLCVQLLEKRAAMSSRVVVSDKLALVISGHLRRLLDSPSSVPR